ncbi:hypothetical protein OA238_c18030 [Octadecabacter arcticus 238]|uniref:PD-(D/E)XK motif protein n=1 Tax=Octadecabacter arcticus 238 TaxID=391616 RepID=M9RH51_9RHOB|nr:PD-(D/E)XK motif protein [Octadecabacter arcticus]AGI71914.1 hypothetical protein OA238_c18030 [Octadecabacter arcticus 238]
MTWTEEGLARIWRALLDTEGSSWAISGLYRDGEVSFHAGRSFPNGLEAIVVDFPAGTIRTSDRLPSGGGFDVVRLPSENWVSGREALALVRHVEGAHELFSMMSVNVLRQLEQLDMAKPRLLLDAFFVRVREWQDFMANKRRKPLSAERQVGLQGELMMLEMLADQVHSPLLALNFWQGPLMAPQDFYVEAGAIEVKSTARANGFLVTISSIEQLDAERWPMYLCGFRFVEDESGESLQQAIVKLTQKMQNSGLGKQFEALLLMSGYLSEHADRYDRQLSCTDSKYFLVSEEFPCLRRSGLHAPIRRVSYDIDMEAIGAEALSSIDMLQSLLGKN